MENYKILRQGNLISVGLIELLKKASFKPSRKFLENEYCMVLSQDCDIVHPKVEEEPFIEFLICHKIEKQDGNLLNGKNPRHLHIIESDYIYEFYIIDRVMILKSELDDFDFGELTSFNDDNIRIIKKWVARRYTRSAFPDNFNKRLFSSKKYNKIASKQISEQISHVFFEVEDTELPDDQKYHLNVLIVSDAKGQDKDDIEDAYYEVFSVSGIELNIRIVTEDQVPLSMLRKYKRWEKDSYSLSGQAAPLDEIDTI